MTTPFPQNPVRLFYFNLLPIHSLKGQELSRALTFVFLRFSIIFGTFLPAFANSKPSKRESFFSREIGYFSKRESFSPS